MTALTTPKPDYTIEQHKAIAARDVSIALAAGAGCGKTFVLTERFLAELAPQPGRDPEQRLGELVAITFTDPAARELRHRIRQLVSKKLTGCPASERGYWRQLQRALDACRVSTIHSLAGDLLRRYAFHLGIDPLFAILDGASSMVLRAEAIQDTLRQELTVRDDDTMELARAWGIEGLKKRVSGLVEHHRSAEFAKWLRATPADALDAWRLFYEEVVWPSAFGAIALQANLLITVLDDCLPVDASDADLKQETLELLRRVADGAPTEGDLPRVCELAVAKRRPFSRNSKKTIRWESDESYEQFKTVAADFRAQITGLPSADFTTATAHRAADLGLRLARLTERAADAYRAAKETRNALDYDDLLALAHKLVTAGAHREVQQEVRAGIKLLMVDEFQDTDRLQVEIVKALAGDVAKAGKLFFVGDDKQSIYRFRGAEPRVFLDLCGEVEEDWRLPLSMNFRSQPAILNFINALFEQVFDDYQRLSPSRPQAAAEPAIEFLWSPLAGKRNEKGWKANSRRKEARAIAARLREVFGSESLLVGDTSAPGGCRPARPGDVAILFRVLSDVQYYEEALREAGIEYYLVGGHAFYTQQEVYDVLHLLRAIASGCDELSLAGVLRSPFFSLADETLFWLGGRGQGLEAGLFGNAPPKEIEGEEREKVLFANKTLAYLRSQKEIDTVPGLLAEAMHRTGYDAALLADFMGERKLANIQKLMEQARTASAAGVGGLDDFTTQLAEFTTSQPKEALATTSPETANVVRLMTVHKAKGLEFPVVVVPDIDRDDNYKPPQVGFHRALGPLVDDPDAEDKDSAASGFKLFKGIEASEDRLESNRLFYVACTRAADYLLLSSGMTEDLQPHGAWHKTLGETFDLATGELQTPWTGAEAERPRVRVEIVQKTVLPRQKGSGKRTNLLKLIEESQRQPPASAELIESVSSIAVRPQARRRFSVTRLSGQIVPAGGWWQGDDQSESGAAPQLDPLGFGTLVHAVLERADFDQPTTIGPWCQSLAPLHDLLHAEVAAREAADLVERFYKSSRAADMRGAKAINKEVEFVMVWPPRSTDESGRFLQGYLDCLYQDSSGRWRVIDYKTNQVSAGGVSTLAGKYELQMLVYGLAVEQIWGVGPDELVLHFLRPGVEHVTPWNEESRDRAIALVEQALERAELSS